MTKVNKTLAELAKLLGATLHGEPTCLITGIATLQKAQTGQLSFLNNTRYRSHLAITRASAVILAPDDVQRCPVYALVTPNPYLAYAKVAALFEEKPPVTPGVHPSVQIAEGCQIHPSASIGPLCVIESHVVIDENVVIGPGCVIGANSHIGAGSKLLARVTLYHGVSLGQNVIVHSGAVIGSDGFGLAQDQGIWHKIPQLGGVVVGDNVEVGANTTIDRGALDNTVIEEGVKLDNQIQIGHNVRVGAHTAIAGCVGIAGSTTIGKHCAIGGGVGILGHLTITDKVMITAGSGVGKSIDEPGVYSSGIDAQPASLWRRNLARIYQLDDNAKRLKELEKAIEDRS